MERLWLQAWIDGLHRTGHQPPVRPVKRPAPIPAPRTPGDDR